MGILDAFTSTNHDALRNRVRSILFEIIEIEKKIEKLDVEIPRAAARGNDEAELRAERTQWEIQKLDLERSLEKIDAAIIREEQANIEKNAPRFSKKEAA